MSDWAFWIIQFCIGLIIGSLISLFNYFRKMNWVKMTLIVVAGLVALSMMVGMVTMVYKICMIAALPIILMVIPLCLIWCVAVLFAFFRISEEIEMI